MDNHRCAPRRERGWAAFGLFLYLVANLAFSGCGPAPKNARSTLNTGVAWVTSINLDHSLVGQIWSTKKTQFVETAEFLQRLRDAPIILIGERHDNPDHHRIQASIISALKPGALVGFEMLNHDDQKALHLAKNDHDIETMTTWAKSGWPEFDIYRPIFKAIFAHKHFARAVHPRRNDIRAVMMGPNSQAHGHSDYDGPISKQGRTALRADIDASHCGHAPASLVNAMMVAQEYKDRTMATTLMEGTQGLQRVLIAGNGHVRRDYGVTNHLPAEAISVGILEVSRAKLKPEDYDPQRFDFVWFTPRLDTLDPCEKYKRALEAMKARYKKRAAPKK